MSEDVRVPVPEPTGTLRRVSPSLDETVEVDTNAGTQSSFLGMDSDDLENMWLEMDETYAPTSYDIEIEDADVDAYDYLTENNEEEDGDGEDLPVGAGRSAPRGTPVPRSGSSSGSRTTSSPASNEQWDDTGPMIEAFYNWSEPYRTQYRIDGARGMAALCAKGGASSGVERRQYYAMRKRLKDLQKVGNHPLMPYLNTTDGNMQYADVPRGTETEYEKLLQKVNAVEMMFGSSAGYLGEEMTGEKWTDIRSDVKSTGAEINRTEVGHGFSREALVTLAKDSAHDIIAHKFTMNRAYPTFKLYFVEEDEHENRFLNFDDFYSFNGVKEFTVHMSRKSPAETATITLQNVAGTLDGTKRNVLTDLDYMHAENRDSRNADPDNTNDSDPNRTVAIESSRDQPFGALVLRPGLNVQLRAGYDNDPGMLEVLLSGRITDVTWSQTGDLAEIVVQSFGTELAQIRKHSPESGGLTAAHMSHTDAGTGEKNIYPTTHHLLGAIMLSPEIKHFGRWEWGQMYQTGESTDANLDFLDYSAESFLGSFDTINNTINWMMENPFGASIACLGGILVIGALATVKVPMVGGPLARVLGSGRIGAASGWVGGIFGRGALWAASGLTRRSTRLITRGGNKLVKENLDEALKIVGRIGPMTRAESALVQGLPEKMRMLLGEGAPGLERLMKMGGYQGFFGRRAAHKFMAGAAEIQTGVALGEAATVQQGVRQMLAAQRLAESNAAFRYMTGFAMGNQVAAVSVGGRSVQHLWNLSFRSIGYGARGAVGLLIAAGAWDVANFGFDQSIGRLISGVRRFFARTKARLLLTPQDDNLYPPSPKDYMRLANTVSFKDRVGRMLIEAAGSVTSSALPGSIDVSVVNDWWKKWTNPPLWVLQKRVTPAQCIYSLQGDYVWDIFEEMTKRHPGWIFGTRPYGLEFRYTMFFGVPSQRYWKAKASNEFVFRMNEIRDRLDEGPIEEGTFKHMWPARKHEQISRDARAAAVSRAREELALPPELLTDTDAVTYTAPPYRIPTGEESLSGPIEAATATHYKREYEWRATQIALKEYLLGLSKRFVPFRRYHLISSESDLVANNITGSEHNALNAVNVTFREAPEIHDDYEASNNIDRTLLIKANSFIPEHMLRVGNSNYPNCRGYTMALRYGMGEIIYGLKEIYRGSITVLGNPRIRPWDVCILLDSYNDIVGPVEVESVVHMFSHETGFITEIKPNAVVIANEISSYPVMEALKMFILAVREGEFDKTAMDVVADLPGWDTLASNMDVEYLQERYQQFITEDYDMHQLFGALGSESSLPAGRLGQAASTGTGAFLGVAAGVTAGLLAYGALRGVGGIGLRVMAAAEARGAAGLVQPGAGLVANNPRLAGSLSGLIQSIGKGGGAKIGGLAGAGTIGGVAGQQGSMTMSGLLQSNSLAWLITGNVLFTKLMQEETAIIVPITKGGVPIVPGMSLRDPIMVWQNIMGKMGSMVEDYIYGARDTLHLWKKYGYQAYMRWDDVQNDIRTMRGY
jgi:hypothetical protein